MTKDFIIPDLGENIASADILKVLIQEGDVVTLDQPVIEIETDKATIEIPSTVAGKVTKLMVKEGGKVKVGDAAFTVEEEGTAAPALAPAVPEPVKAPEPEYRVEEPKASVPGSKEFTLPDLGENIASASVLKVLVKAGQEIKIDDPVLEIETDKATIEVPSNISGKVLDVYIKDGDKISVGQVVFKAEAGASAAAVKSSPAVAAPAVRKEETKPAVAAMAAKETGSANTVLVDMQTGISANPAPAAPSSRRFAREIGVDINLVTGSGPGGRISIDDVKAYMKKINIERSAGGGVSGGLFGIKAEQLPDFTRFGEIERVAMSNVRAKTAEHLSYAWASVPHVTQFDKADITDLEAVRKALSPKVEAKGAKLTVTAILIKIAASALKNFPQFNASVDMEKKEIIYKKYFNIGVAVDTDRGLIVPVIRDADKKNISEIAADLTVIAEKAKNRKVSPDDLSGACFSISNLGGIGGTYFTPIVNTPEVAILGVSRGAYEPVYKNGEFVPRLMLPLSLSYDHRLIDGADAIRFLRWMIEALEQPMKLLVEG